MLGTSIEQAPTSYAGNASPKILSVGATLMSPFGALLTYREGQQRARYDAFARPPANSRYLRTADGRCRRKEVVWRTGAGQAVGVGPDSPPSTCALPLATLNPAATHRMSQQPLIGPPAPRTSDKASAPLQTRISAPSGKASVGWARPRQEAKSQMSPACAASRTRSHNAVGGAS